MAGLRIRSGPATMRNHGRTTGTNADGFRRVEVITGVGRRRRWSRRRRRGSWPRAWIRHALLGGGPAVRAAREPAIYLAAAAAAERIIGRDHPRAGVRAGAAGGGQRCSSRGGRPDGDCARPGRGAGRDRCERRGAAAGARGGAEPGVILVPPGCAHPARGAAGRLPQGHGWARPPWCSRRYRPTRFTSRCKYLPHPARRQGSSGSGHGSCSLVPAGAGRRRRSPFEQRPSGSRASPPRSC